MSRAGANGTTGPSQPDLSGTIGMVLVDRQALVREGMRLLVEREPDMAVVGEAGSVGEALALGVDPDVVVTELDLPDAQGSQVPVALRPLGAAVFIVVVTYLDHPAIVQEVVAAGAHGYLLKSAAVAELLLAIRTVAHGEPYLQPSLGFELARAHDPAMEAHTGNGNGNGQLSPKEAEVLRLVALGHTNAEAAGLLAVSLRTIESHRSRIVQKLGRVSRAELVRYAYEVGLVDPRI
jgi:two-component system, NarL family, response regulator NreC